MKSENLKAVIMAAGYGSRLLPITKTIPKEMLPLGNRPAIDFILDEIEEAGIQDVIFITSRRKKALEDYLDRDIELENAFKENKKEDALKLIQPRNLNFTFIHQSQMNGTGNALLLTESVLGQSPFILYFPDDIILHSIGLSKQMCDLYSQYHKGIFAALDKPLSEDISRFGVLDIDQKYTDKVYLVKGIYEKPTAGKEPSRFISIGRYLLQNQIFDLLKEGTKKCHQREFFLTESLHHLAQEAQMISYLVEGQYFDLGTTEGYIHSLMQFNKLDSPNTK